MGHRDELVELADQTYNRRARDRRERIGWADHDAMVGCIRAILGLIGENPDREGLVETPERVAHAYTEWTSGYGRDPADVLRTFPSDGVDEMVFQGNIAFSSMCEHHLCPFFGVAHIGYIPNGEVVGLSKLSRVVDIYAKRLTIQERIGQEVSTAISEYVKPKGIGVVLQARHTCMETRGVCKPGTITITSSVWGNFRTSPEVRAEFLSMVNAASTGLMRP